MNENPARAYATIAASSESTVVAEWEAEPSKETSYQSEAQLEARMIELLQSQAYEYLPIAKEADLVANVRS